MSLPELLCPAGNFDRLKTAIFYGADAVYLGGRGLNLRAKTQGFDFEHHLPEVKDYLHRLAYLPVDGLIIADPVIISLAKKICPHIPLHLNGKIYLWQAVHLLTNYLKDV